MRYLLSVIAFLATINQAVAQYPEKMTYQAVIRNGSNNLIVNHLIGIKISIIKNSMTGTPVYIETHTPKTNDNGLITLEIGGGNVVQGTFANINWGDGTYFIKTESDPNGGANYTIVSTSQLLSVPYAFYAKDAFSVKQTKTLLYLSR